MLTNVSLDVAAHDVVCLIGASGSGKSTLLRCINLLEKVDAGSITVDGQNITYDKLDVNELRQHIGIVFQAYNLFPHMTVLQNVTLSPRKTLGRSKKQAEDRAYELLDRIGLREKAEEFPDRLSGGQQQRVAIVRALAMDPKLMLLDEITSALDPQLVNEVLQLVRGLSEVGMTMIIATHEMDFAREVASKICFLDTGVILEEGPPEPALRRSEGASHARVPEQRPRRGPHVNAFLKRLAARKRTPLTVSCILAAPLYFLSLMLASMAMDRPGHHQLDDNGTLVEHFHSTTASLEAKIWLAALVPSALAIRL